MARRYQHVRLLVEKASSRSVMDQKRLYIEHGIGEKSGLKIHVRFTSNIENLTNSTKTSRAHVSTLATVFLQTWCANEIQKADHYQAQTTSHWQYQEFEERS